MTTAGCNPPQPANNAAVTPVIKASRRRTLGRALKLRTNSIVVRAFGKDSRSPLREKRIQLGDGDDVGLASKDPFDKKLVDVPIGVGACVVQNN